MKKKNLKQLLHQAIRDLLPSKRFKKKMERRLRLEVRKKFPKGC